MLKKIANVFDGMTKGLFATVIVGTVIYTIGDSFGNEFLMTMGTYAKCLMGPAIGVGIARRLEYKEITTSVAVIVGAITAGTITPKGIVIGDPLSGLIGCVIVLYILNRFENKRVMDVFLVPVLGIILAGIMHILLLPLASIMSLISDFLNSGINSSPVAISLFIALIFSVFITGPLSSAALGIILGLEGVVAFVAVVATASQMSGFFMMSLRDNGFVNSLLVLFGSSKLQLKNVALNQLIFIPPLIASLICGVAVGVFTDVVSVTSAAGMGNCALIGPLLTITANGNSLYSIIIVLLSCFIMPMIITYFFYKIMVRRRYIKSGDLKL